jgi:hypothetical protein
MKETKRVHPMGEENNFWLAPVSRNKKTVSFIFIPGSRTKNAGFQRSEPAFGFFQGLEAYASSNNQVDR